MDNKLLRCSARDVEAQVVFDQRQRKVYARRNTGGCPSVIVPDENAVTFDLDFWVSAATVIRAGPVRGGAAIVQQSGLPQQTGSRATSSEERRVGNGGVRP